MLDSFENGYVFRRPNVTSKYFSYYLPSDMHRFQSEETGVVIEYNDSSILMSLNIAGLLHRNISDMPLSLESGFYPEKNLMYNREGSFVNYNGGHEPYLCSIYRFEDRSLIILRTQGFKIYSFTNEQEQNDVQVDLFDIIIPKNGHLSDMIIDDSGTKKEEPVESSSPQEEAETEVEGEDVGYEEVD